MTFVVLWAVSLAGSLGLLVLTTTRLLWPAHRLFGGIVAVVGALGALLPVLNEWPFVQAIGLGMVGLWISLCGVRLVYGRLEELFLKHSTRRAALAAGVLAAIAYISGVIGVWLLLVVLVSAVAVAWLFTVQTLWAMRHYKLRNLRPLPSLRDLPTVTVAIPARNETHALSNCLQAALASTYSKLEVLVLDDCSQDSIGELIRTFAHDGVRFIQGDQPSTGWLGKNNALRTLAEQASGDYILFVDVDTKLEPDSISKVVSYALSHKLSMVSVLARRRDGLHWGTLLWQLRYYWQIALPITKRRVPVASQCWLINSDELRALGGFAAVRQKIVPEGYFARALAARDAYRFVAADAEFGVTTAKKWISQNDTALRLLYPTFKRQPFYVLAAVWAICVMLTPFMYILAWPWVTPSAPGLALLAGLATGLFMLGYGLVVTKVNRRAWPLTILFLPFSLAQEAILLIASMLKYEFGVVDWKGRNVCYPVILDPKFIKGDQKHGEKTRLAR